MKKIIIDINHPCHVHLFKNFIFEIQKKGHSVWVCVKDIPAAKQLLTLYNINYFDLGKKFDSIGGKFITQFHYANQILNIIRKNDIGIGIGSSINIPHISKFSKMTSFVFDDDDAAVEPLFARFGHPFADYIVSPDVLAYERNKSKHITYSGYHELAYLHPQRFKPDPGILSEVGLNEKETFFILRFNAFKAHHDIGVQGLPLQRKRDLIDLLSQKGKIFITTEREIEPEFAQYQLKISPEKIHSLLFFTTMLIGDSQTMTSEAAVLGMPAIRSNSLVGRISYLEEEEHRYGLTFGFRPDQTEQMMSKIVELLDMPNLKQEWQKRRQKMLAEKIDVTAFMVWLVENYPQSIQILKQDPNYQLKFK